MNTFTLPFHLALLWSSISGFQQVHEDRILPELTTIIYEEQSDFLPGDPLGPDCLFTSDFQINVANLAPVGSDTSGLFPLPAGVAPMYLAYSIGNMKDTVQLTLFDYIETLDGLQGPVNIYRGTVDVVYEVSEECFEEENGGKIDLPWSVSLLTYDIALGYDYYPVCSYTDSGEIFTCNAFQETVSLCADFSPICNDIEHTTADGEVHIDCGECSSSFREGNNPVNNPPGKKRSSSTSEHAVAVDAPVSVQPNPFDNELLLGFPPTEEPQDITIRLIDPAGRLIYSKSLQTAAQAFDWSVQTAFLPSGLYLLQIHRKDSNRTIKIFKY